MKKKVIAALMTVSMLSAALAGCGKTGNDAPETANGSKTTNGSGTADGSGTKNGSDSGNADGAGTASGVTIRVGNMNGKGSDEMTAWPTEFAKKMEEKLGVKIDVVGVTDEQFDLALASGSPNFDIINCTKSREQQVLDAGMAIALDDYLDEYGTHIKLYEDRNNLSREFLSNGTGKLYFKRIQTGREAPGNDLWGGYVVRWDWYKELGCPPINTDEEYLDILTRMLEMHPVNDAGGTTYGIGNYTGTGLWSWSVQEQFQLGHVTIVPGLELNMNNDEIYNAFTDERSTYWVAMEFWNKAYNMDLLDPDIFTMKSDDLKQKVLQGTYAGAVRTWDVGDYYVEEAKKDPDTIKGYMSVFPETGGMAGWYGATTIAGWEQNSWFVTTDCKNPGEAVLVLDYMDDEDNMREFYSGFKGEHWNVDANGKAAETAAGSAFFAAGGDPMDKAGMVNSASGSWMRYLCADTGEGLHSDGGRLNLISDGSVRYGTLNSLQKDYADYFQVEYPAQVHEKQVEAGLAIDRTKEPKDLYMVLSAVPADMARIKTQIETMLESYIPDLVTAATQEEYDKVKEKVMADCIAAGSDTLYEWAEESYTTAKKTFDDAKAKYGIK